MQQDAIVDFKLADTTEANTQIESATRGFKQLRADGDTLLSMYKVYSKDVLENDTIRDMRQRLIVECEQFLVNNLLAGKNVVDFIWKYCWYEVISAFKLQRKRFTSIELDLLQGFIYSGIEYFERLSQNSSSIRYRCLLYKGDLWRYKHKLLKTDDNVLKLAEKCYKQAIELELQSGSSYSKLACIYESNEPYTALNFLLRAVANKATAAVANVKKLNGKNVPSSLISVFSLSQSAFQSSSFQPALDNFKSFMDEHLSLSDNTVIQNLYTACLLSMAIDSLENKDEDRLKMMVPLICQYFNTFIPILIDQLNKSDILQERRDCPSPFESDEETDDFDEVDVYTDCESEPTLYETVLFPVIPLLLTLNEWLLHLNRWLAGLKFSVGSRMICQSVLFNFAELLNCFVDLLGHRIQKKADEWPKAAVWQSTSLDGMIKSTAFGILIDSLKQSIYSIDHPLDFDTKFKCTKESWFMVFFLDTKFLEKRKEGVVHKEFVVPRCLIVSHDSFLNHWPKIIFMIDNLKTTTLLMSVDTIEKLEKRSLIKNEFKNCLLHIQHFRAEDRCLIYNDNIGNLVEVATMLGRNNLQVALIVENSTAANEQNGLSSNVWFCSANEMYLRFCEHAGIENTILPFIEL